MDGHYRPRAAASMTGYAITPGRTLPAPPAAGAFPPRTTGKRTGRARRARDRSAGHGVGRAAVHAAADGCSGASDGPEAWRRTNDVGAGSMKPGQFPVPAPAGYSTNGHTAGPSARSGRARCRCQRARRYQDWPGKHGRAGAGQKQGRGHSQAGRTPGARGWLGPAFHATHLQLGQQLVEGNAIWG